ncbi:MAG: Eco29kI family restriction endonuclease [Verrucomicrobia bacterium]|nr:Eco29kI family restriction endonuclease [Verrucomicrobiota bacterium]
MAMVTEPVMEDPTPYNPLAKKNLAASIISRLLCQKPWEMPPPKFAGAGVYLIYYTGGFEAYEPLSRANRNGRFAQPIYVGKAVPAGARKGGEGLDTPHGEALYKRLCKHSESLKSARNLAVTDFKCRWLVVDEVFITLGETMLISHFKPLWNLVVEGFGNNPPGGGRAKGKKPMWDIIHPGRAWAEELSAAMSSETVLSLIARHFDNVRVPPGKFEV